MNVHGTGGSRNDSTTYWNIWRGCSGLITTCKKKIEYKNIKIKTFDSHRKSRGAQQSCEVFSGGTSCREKWDGYDAWGEKTAAVVLQKYFSGYKYSQVPTSSSTLRFQHGKARYMDGWRGSIRQHVHATANDTKPAVQWAQNAERWGTNYMLNYWI
jgi:hypothetical protein